MFTAIFHCVVGGFVLGVCSRGTGRPGSEFADANFDYRGKFDSGVGTGEKVCQGNGQS